VTFAEWDACVAAGGCNGHRPGDRGWGRGNRPVINVSWNDAKAYVAWLSRKTGKTYRLLSEAEWEYAARAGTTTPFSTGQTITTDQANFDGNSTYGGGRKGVFRQKTVEVGSFAPNPFGLYDMHGNVWEWVEDCWNDDYTGIPMDGSASIFGDCNTRALRGGSWAGGPGFLRSASRGSDWANHRSDVYGFRVARTLN
jgi:formylglycine-generating enzyme required for sulfatase activity